MQDMCIFEWFISFTDTRGHAEGGNVVGCSTKTWMKDICEGEGFG